MNKIVSILVFWLAFSFHTEAQTNQQINSKNPEQLAKNDIVEISKHITLDEKSDLFTSLNHTLIKKYTLLLSVKTNDEKREIYKLIHSKLKIILTPEQRKLLSSTDTNLYYRLVH